MIRWAKPKPKQAVEPRTLITPIKESGEVVLPEIVGINLADGLKRVAGNRQLYRDLLGEFAVKQGNAAAEISIALESGNLSLAERIAHTVKGVAGNLGIAETQRVAEKLVMAIRENEKVSAAQVQFASVMDAQVSAIEKALLDSASPRPEKMPTSPFNAEVAAVAIARLRILLEAGDGDADELFLSLQDAVEGTVEKTHLEGLSASISDFDFDAALVKLDEIANRCTTKWG